MLPLGTALPSFALPTVEGECWSTTQLDERPLLVLFICAHCPFVKHVEPSLTALAEAWASELQIVAISSNSVISHPQDAPDQLLAQKQRCGWAFPYLHDHEQTVARALQAACTPDSFLFDRQRRLVYRGQLDGSRPGGDQLSDCADLRRALEALHQGAAPLASQRPSIGCGIKWHQESP